MGTTRVDESRGMEATTRQEQFAAIDKPSSQPSDVSGVVCHRSAIIITIC